MLHLCMKLVLKLKNYYNKKILAGGIHPGQTPQPSWPARPQNSDFTPMSHRPLAPEPAGCKTKNAMLK